MGTAHTAEKWLEMKPLIVKHYINDNKKLEEVAQIMRNQYGFHASRRMYKTRLAKWSLQQKNVRHSEWIYMDAVYNYRKRNEGKETKFTITKGSGTDAATHYRSKRCIDKHFDRDKRRAQATVAEALANLPDGISIRAETPGASETNAILPDSPPEAGSPFLTDISPVCSYFPPSPPSSSHASAAGTDYSAVPLWSEHGAIVQRPPYSAQRFNDVSGSLPCFEDDDFVIKMEMGLQQLTQRAIDPAMVNLNACDEQELNRFVTGSPCRPISVSSEHHTPCSSQHPRNLMSKCSAAYLMAFAYVNQNQPRAAAAKASEACQYFEDVLRNARPYVLDVLVTFSTIIASLGHYDLLAAFLQHSCSALARVLGANGAYTLLFEYLLAVVQQDQGILQFQGAKLPFCLEAVKHQEGEKSRNVLIVEYYVAWHLHHTGNGRGSLLLLQNCLNSAGEILERCHLITIKCLVLMYQVLWKVDRIQTRQQAIHYLEDAVKRCLSVVGKENPYRLELQTHLAVAYDQLGQIDTAVQNLREVLESQTILLGFASRRTFYTVELLASLLFNRGRVDDEKRLRETMTQRYVAEWVEQYDEARKGGKRPPPESALQQVAESYLHTMSIASILNEIPIG